MTSSDRVNELRIALLEICKTIESLAHNGIKIEFNIHTNERNETRLTAFKAMQEMKLTQ